MPSTRSSLVSGGLALLFAASSLLACAGPSARGGATTAKPGAQKTPERKVPKKPRPLPPLAGPATTRPALQPPPKKKPVLPTGSLSRDEVRGTVARHQGQVRACYEKQLIRNPNLAGRILVSITIGLDGSVREAGVEHSTLNSPELSTCVTKALRTWRFPKPRGGIVIVKYPFHLRASKP